MNKTILILAFLSILLASCMSEKQKEAVKKTDEMLTRIEVVRSSLTTEEVESYRSIYDTTKTYVEFFEHLPPNFERNDSIMELIYYYGTVDKCFKKLHKNYISGILTDLETSEAQIKNLQHDIKEGFFEDGEIDNYIHTEDSILSGIEQVAKSKIEYAKAQAGLYNELHPKIVNLKKEFEEKYY
jgi:hypothetical protein